MHYNSGSVYILSYVYVHQFCVVNDSILCVTVAYTNTVMSMTYSVSIYRAVDTVSASAVAVAIVSMKGEPNTQDHYRNSCMEKKERQLQ